MTTVHRLTEKDTTGRSALCCICGPVKILPAGRGWVCATKKLQRKREWAAANPDRVAASRAKPGIHRLTSREDRQGVCAVCGPVEVVPWGRGWTCSNRSQQLRRIQQSKPAERCLDCRAWYTSLNDGRCESCTIMNTPYQSMIALLSTREFSEIPDDGKDRTVPALKTIGDKDVAPEWRWALKSSPDWSRLDAM